MEVRPGILRPIARRYVVKHVKRGYWLVDKESQGGPQVIWMFKGRNARWRAMAEAALMNRTETLKKEGNSENT